VLDKIPLGQKNNCFSVIDNSVNNERKRNNKYNRFCDDLCSWDSEKGTIVKSYYILSHNFKCVYKKNNEYCLVQSKKRVFVPLTPQPEESDIVVMNRYYTSLKRQKDYKKRVTWFSSSSDPDISKVALVEYIGELKQMEDVHGNSK